jgi:hypothetical protein
MDIPTTENTTHDYMEFILVIQEVAGKQETKKYIQDLTETLTPFNVVYKFSILHPTPHQNKKPTYIGGTSDHTEATFPYNLFQTTVEKIRPTPKSDTKPSSSYFSKLFSWTGDSGAQTTSEETTPLSTPEQAIEMSTLPSFDHLQDYEGNVNIQLKIYDAVNLHIPAVVGGIEELKQWCKRRTMDQTDTYIV